MADECVPSVEHLALPHPAAFAVEGKVILVIDDAPIVRLGNERIAWQMGILSPYCRVRGSCTYPTC
jgi:hypothetical protein